VFERQLEDFFLPGFLKILQSNFFIRCQVSSINRVLRNLATQKEQSAANVGNSESVYDKLRMFNGGAAAAGWAAWYPSAAAPHLGLPQHPNSALHGLPRDDTKRGNNLFHIVLPAMLHSLLKNTSGKLLLLPRLCQTPIFLSTQSLRCSNYFARF
jgi:hypothetical protein